MSLLERRPTLRQRDMLRRSRRTSGIARRMLLSCGVAAPLLYMVGHDLLAALLYEGYSPFSQAISELSSFGAPTRPAVLALLCVYSLLTLAFGIGVRQSTQGGRALRVAGDILVASAVLVPVWFPFPMTSRQDMDPSVAMGLTDTMHLVLSGVTNLLMFCAIGFGSTAFGLRFRIYSILTVVVSLVFGFLMSTEARGIAAGEPTPWMGVNERIAAGAWMLWMGVLAVMLLRRTGRGPELADAT
ncbi:MAG TPA: DUF998 domain-containing protein [Nocardioidaceae bacterium]|nr:DUF998 domain-containing protein [Nocardioidaceae bacterium]